MRNWPCQLVADRKIYVETILRENGSAFVIEMKNLKITLRAN
jgi:hypothetical protein